ncbi:hypothetical protein B5F94_10965 [Flavonifractor sp. An4]|nr:hypothetical protein B5F94_10965 [Flavonifractor sp. An4]
MEVIKWSANKMPKSGDQQLSVMALDEVQRARRFHRSFPQYAVAPLARLSRMAGQLGLKDVFVKDESYRFGLNAFKVLGGSFAMARYIAKELGKSVDEMSYDYLTSNQLKQEFGQATFFTATDGNHGRGVAWAANRLGQKAVVHMPKGSSKSRFDNIAREGAKVTIEEVNYSRCTKGYYMRGRTPYGFDTEPIVMDGIKTKKLVENAEMDFAELIYQMYAEPSSSYGDITRYFVAHDIKVYGKALTRAFIAQLLRNPVYVKADMAISQRSAAVISPASRAF